MAGRPHVPWYRDPNLPYALAILGVLGTASSVMALNRLGDDRQGLEDRATVAEGKLAPLATQNTGLQADLIKAQEQVASEEKQIKALQAQLTQAKQDQGEALRTQRQQLQKESSQQVAKLQAALDTAQAQPAVTAPPQGDAGYVPNDTPATEATPAETPPATPSESDLASDFRNQCLEAVQAFFDGAEVNRTSGGMAMPERWIAGSPYWFWNVNIRVSGTEHVEPFKCRSSRDKGFEALQGW
jgi:hypothetical protein